MSFQNRNYPGPFILALLNLVSENVNTDFHREKLLLSLSVPKLCLFVIISHHVLRAVGVKTSFFPYHKSAALMAFKIWIMQQPSSQYPIFSSEPGVQASVLGDLGLSCLKAFGLVSTTQDVCLSMIWGHCLSPVPAVVLLRCVVNIHCHLDRSESPRRQTSGHVFKGVSGVG